MKSSNAVGRSGIKKWIRSVKELSEKKHPMFPNLFSPIKVGDMVLKNRYIQPPNIKGMANEDGSINQRTLDNYHAEARGGAAAITVMASYVRPDGQAFGRQIAIDNDARIAGLADLAYTIKRAGAKAGIQLFHAGAIADPRRNGWRRPISASTMPSFRNPNIVCHELSKDEIGGLIDAYAAAAGRAKEAGFDYVNIHANHGSLVHQFLSPTFNYRTDEYGKDKMLFSQRLIERLKEVVGPDFPIIWRMSAVEYAGDKGYTLEQMLEEYVPRYIEYGIAALDVSAGGVMSSEALAVTIPPMYLPRGILVQYAEVIRKIAQPKGIPVTTVGKLMDPVLAESILADGKADLINIARPIFADPELPRKAYECRPEDIRKCIGCNWCTTTHIFAHGSCMCAINPEFGREREYAIRSADQKKVVWIAGGGPAGMETARVLVQRGHQVTLFEKNGEYGGTLRLASNHPNLNTRDLLNLVDYLEGQMSKLGVDVRLNTELTPEMVAEGKPDVVVVATGAKPIKPEIPGLDKSLVVWHDDYLTDPDEYELGGDIVILGGGEGAELAISVARGGAKVTLIEESEQIGRVPYLHDQLRLIYLLKYLEDEKVQILTNTKVKEILDDGVRVIDKEGNDKLLPANNVIVALGHEGDESLTEALMGAETEVHTIGDAVAARSVAQAIDDAAYVSRVIGTASHSMSLATPGFARLYADQLPALGGELLEKNIRYREAIEHGLIEAAVAREQ